MAGAYCRYCGQRCFVHRVLPDGSWSGHMATCADGMAHDLLVTGHTHLTAINPLTESRLYATGTAEDMAADWPDHPAGCTCTWCVPTPELAAEVAEMLRKPMTFPHEDEAPF